MSFRALLRLKIVGELMCRWCHCYLYSAEQLKLMIHSNADEVRRLQENLRQAAEAALRLATDNSEYVSKFGTHYQVYMDISACLQRFISRMYRVYICYQYLYNV